MPGPLEMLDEHVNWKVRMAMNKVGKLGGGQVLKTLSWEEVE